MNNDIRVKILGICSALFLAAIIINFIPYSADIPIVNKIAHSDSIKIYKDNVVQQNKEIYDKLVERSIKTKTIIIKNNKSPAISNSDNITSIK